MDVSDNGSIAQFLETVHQKYKEIHVLVNNAGVAAKGDAFDTEVLKYTFSTVNIKIFRIFMEQLNFQKR